MLDLRFFIHRNYYKNIRINGWQQSYGIDYDQTDHADLVPVIDIWFMQNNRSCACTLVFYQSGGLCAILLNGRLMSNYLIYRFRQPRTPDADQQLTRDADQQLTPDANQQLTRDADQQLTRDADQQLTPDANQQLTRDADQQLTPEFITPYSIAWHADRLILYEFENDKLEKMTIRDNNDYIIYCCYLYPNQKIHTIDLEGPYVRRIVWRPDAYEVIARCIFDTDGVIDSIYGTDCVALYRLNPHTNTLYYTHGLH